MSSGRRRIQLSTMYMKTQSAMPETIADKMKMIGMMALPHHGLALMEPKMKPT